MAVAKVFLSVLVLVILSTTFIANFIFLRSSVLNVSAVEALGSIGIYYDENSSQRVNSISWGVLSPGERTEVTVYVRNEGNESLLVALRPTDWSPSDSRYYLDFSWSCDHNRIRVGEVAEITQILRVSPNIKGIVNFSFDIAYETYPSPALNDFDIVFATNPNVRMIYPSFSPNKPLNCSAAMVSDWTASAFVYTKLEKVSEGQDTDGSFVNQTTGKPLGYPGTGIISFGGPVVNPIVKYAESDLTPKADRAPIRFHVGSGILEFRHWNGSNIVGANLPITVAYNNEDMFVIEVYKDRDGRYVMLAYGFGWKGTYAAGKYFDTIMYPNLRSHGESWIIVKWEDTNGDGFVNGPNDGDTYSIIARGN